MALLQREICRKPEFETLTSFIVLKVKCAEGQYSEVDR